MKNNLCFCLLHSLLVIVTATNIVKANESLHLSRYREHLNKLEQIKCDFVQKTWNENEDEKTSEIYIETIVGNLLLNSSKRQKHLFMNITLESEPKSKAYSVIDQENIFSNDLNITCSVTDNDPDTLSLTTLLDVNNVTWDDQVYSLPIGCVLGYVSFQSGKSRYIPYLIQESRITTFQDVVDGHECTKIEGNTKEYHITVWIDPKCDYSMRRFLLNVRNPEPKMPKRIEFTANDFKPVGATFIPSSCKVSQTFPPYQRRRDHLPADLIIEIPDVPQQVRHKEVTITGCDLNMELSSSDFFPRTSIPNGSSVQARDAPQIEYIWYDGKIVPKTDELMLKIARAGHRFMPGPDEPRFWFMGISIFLIVFAIGFKAYKKYKGIET